VLAARDVGEVADQLDRPAPLPRGLGRPGAARGALEEVVRPDAQRLRGLVQAAGRDPVEAGPVLVGLCW
jgi:hypothetical protein